MFTGVQGLFLLFITGYLVALGNVNWQPLLELSTIFRRFDDRKHGEIVQENDEPVTIFVVANSLLRNGISIQVRVSYET